MRLLAIDYGTKRTGIAVTDPLQIIASGLCTVETPTLLAFLKKYTAEEAVEAFVIGQPKRLNNEDSSVETHIQQFITQLQKEFPTARIVASGGVRNLEDIKSLEAKGVMDSIVGKALYEGTITLEEIAGYNQR